MSIERPFSSPASPEKIAEAALKLGDKIYTGRGHIDALEKMQVDIPNWNDYEESLEQGFLTSTGRFVTREEAGHIAKSSSQLDHLEENEKDRDSKYLASESIRKGRNS